MQVFQVASATQSRLICISKPSVSARLLARAGLVSSSSVATKCPWTAVSVAGAFPWLAGASTHERLQLARGRSSAVCMATAAPVEVLVKAATGFPDKLGDCPFSQRVLLTLEEKGIPYDAKYVDTTNKPAWFLEANPEGKVPVVKFDGKWVADSDVITGLLEEKYPDPSLAAPPLAAGSGVFGAFVQFLVSKDPGDGKEQALLDQLKALDEHLKLNGPYLNGEGVSALDLGLAPKLYHIKIVLGHYKKWCIPAEFASLNSYIETIHSRESFLKTQAPEEFVVKGWESKVNSS